MPTIQWTGTPGGPRRLKTYFDLPCSQGAIYRVLRQNGLVRKRKKKWKKRRDLRKLKAALKPFEKLILDGKDLKDIEHYWPQMRIKRLPEYQYTARDVRTGATYFAFSDTTTPPAPRSSFGTFWSTWRHAVWIWAR